MQSTFGNKKKIWIFIKAFQLKKFQPFFFVDQIELS